MRIATPPAASGSLRTRRYVTGLTTPGEGGGFEPVKTMVATSWRTIYARYAENITTPCARAKLKINNKSYA